MSIHLDLHFLQSTSYANLNRDDLGAPKTAIYGGKLRARISSQCLKRNIRVATNRSMIRSRKIHELIAAQLTTRGWNPDEAAMAGIDAVDALTADRGKDGEALLFLTEQQITDLVTLLDQDLGQAAYEPAAQAWRDIVADPKIKDDKRLGAARKYLAADKTAVLDAKANRSQLATRDAIIARKDGAVALFGRMLAAFPQGRVDAAMKVAHALSTHPVALEQDYFTAMDDLAPDTGAGHLGTNEFTAAVYYRYSTIDVSELLTVLNHDVNAVTELLNAVVTATVNAFPTGKQTGTAVANPPALAYFTVRTDQPLNHAIAFETPAQAEPNGGYLTPSVTAFANTARGYADMGYHQHLTWHGHASLLPLPEGDTALGDRHTMPNLIADAVTAAVNKAQ